MSLFKKYGLMLLGSAMAMGVTAGVAFAAKESMNASQVNAEDSLAFTLAFVESSTSSDSTSAYSNSAVSNVFSSGQSNVSSITGVTKAYAGKSGYGSKFGTSSAVGSVSFTLSKSYTFSKVVINAVQYSTKEYAGFSFSCGSDSLGTTGDLTASLADYTITNSASKSGDTYTIATSSKRSYVKSISFYVSESGGSTKSLSSISAELADSTKEWYVGDTVTTSDLKVTATYSDASTADVTSSASITSGATLSKGTNTVVASYTEGSVTKTSNVSIEANKAADVLTYESFGVRDSSLSSTTYGTHTYTSTATEASYSGYLAASKTQTYIQFNKSNAGIVVTNSPGYIRKISFTGYQTGSSTKYLDVYAKNSAYESASDLYSSGTSGTKLTDSSVGFSGSSSASNQETISFEIQGNYRFFGLQLATSYTLFLSEIKVVWEPSDDPLPVEYNIDITDTSDVVKVGANKTLEYTASADVTWSSSNEAVATVENGVVTAVSKGKATITATCGTEKDTFVAYVLDQAGTESDPLDASNAASLAEYAGTSGTDKEYYVGGYVLPISGTTMIDTTYGNGTFNVSDGSSTFQFYRIYNLEKAKFTSADQLSAGDYVVGVSKVTKYGTTYEFTSGGQLISIADKTPTSVTATGSCELAVGDSWTFADSGSIVTANYEDSTALNVTSCASVDKAELTVAEGENVVTVTFDGVSTTIVITGIAKTVSSIAITTQPSRTSYAIGESIDVSGMVVTATYDDGSSADVTADCELVNHVATGETVTVLHTPSGKTATFSISVSETGLLVSSFTMSNKGDVSTSTSGSATLNDSIEWNSSSAYMLLERNESTTSLSTTASEIRCYKGSTLTISCSQSNLSSVIFDCSSTGTTSYVNSFSQDYVTNGTISKNGNVVTLIPTDKTADVTIAFGAQVRFNSVTVQAETAVDAKISWAASFIEGTGNVCLAGQNGATPSDALLSVWEDSWITWDDLSADDKAALTSGTADVAGDVVEQALARYDYIVEKYGAAALGEPGNYLERPATPAGSASFLDNIGEETSAMTMCAVAMVTGLATTAGFFFLRKRKHA